MYATIVQCFRMIFNDFEFARHAHVIRLEVLELTFLCEGVPFP